MLKLTIDDTPIYVGFTHCPRGPQQRRTTRCEILYGYNPKDLALMSQGEAACGEDDNFSRKLGRKISLTRALKHLDRTARAEVWKTYWAQQAFPK